MDGVAVSSDTLVTLGGKTIPNDSKIIELGNEHKCVVLVSGNAHMNGVSVRQLINKWASKLEGPQEDLYDYADSFMEWCSLELSRKSELLVKSQEIALVSSIVRANFSTINRDVDSEWYEKPNRPELYIYPDRKDDTEAWVAPKDNPQYMKVIREITNSVIQRKLDNYKRYKPFYQFSPNQARDYLRRDVEVQEVVDSIIEEFEYTGYAANKKAIAKTKELLRELSHQALGNFYERSSDTTLAFIGYGKDSDFPATLSLTCRGVYGGGLRFLGQNSDNEWNLPFLANSINSQTKAMVDYFAQTDTIFGFLNGFTANVYWKIRNNLTSTLGEVSEYISSHHADHDRDSFISNVIDDVMNDVYNADSTSNLTPQFENSFSAMGLSNLAEVSELLIHMQSLAAFGEDNMNTVGGVIETLTIDKKFGVRWRNRVPIPQ